jgi:hypothetical protein
LFGGSSLFGRRIWWRSKPVAAPDALGGRVSKSR